MKKEMYIGALLICISATMWGLDGVALTPQLYNLDVPFVVFMLHLLPFTIMNVFMWRQYRFLKVFDREDYIIFGMIAFFGGSLGTLAIVKALFLVNFKHLSVVVLLQKLQPIFAILLASVLLKEKLKKRFGMWAAVAILASYFLTFGFHLPSFDTGEHTAAAALWSILAAFSFGSATVFGKKILQKYDFMTSTFYRYGFTTLFMLLFVLITGKIGIIHEVTGRNWMFFMIIGLSTGSGAIFLYYYGLKKVRAMVATICELCFPLATIIFDYVFNNNVLSIVQWVSAFALLFSIVRINMLHNRE